VLALLLTACAGGGKSDATGRLSLAPSTTTTTTAEDARLGALLPADALPGFVRADAELDAGPLDVDAAAATDEDPAAERDRLRSHGFRHGLSRVWLGPKGDTVFVAVYDLADAPGYQRDWTATLVPRSSARFPTEAGDGYTTVEPSLTAHAVSFVRGGRWFLVVVASTAGRLTPDDTRTLARSVMGTAGA
jgi:hypothetical protein